MAYGLAQLDVILRDQLAANLEQIGPFEIGSPPGYVAFIQNMTADQQVVHIVGSDERDGDYYAEYGDDSPVTVEPYGREIAVIYDVPRYVGLYLEQNAGDGVKLTLISFDAPNFDARRHQVTV